MRGWRAGGRVRSDASSWALQLWRPIRYRPAPLLFRHLSCHGCPVQLRGRLSPSLHHMKSLRKLHLANNSLYGSLPPEWGDPSGGFVELREL